MILHYCYKLFMIIGMLTLLSCTPNHGKNLDSRDDDLYNRVGYKPGSTPYDIRDGNRGGIAANSGIKVVPDYYYRVPDKKFVKKKKKVRKVSNVVPVIYEPSSRYYNNPYSFKPPLNFPYFDSDQYYVPPRGISGRGHDAHLSGPNQEGNADLRKRQLY